MTTFDPQPQSRRAVRQTERAESEGFTPFPPSTGAAAPNFYPDASRDMWDTTARRAAQLQQPPADRVEQHHGRRSATPPAEPLTYSTQARPEQASPAPDLPPTQAIARQDQPQYRVRDFSPEGRRAQLPAAWQNAPAPPSADVEYHTEARLAPVVPIVPVAPVPASSPVQHTLTRRELRAMQQAEQDASITAQSAAASIPAPAAVPALIDPPVAAPVEPQPAALVEQRSPFEALFEPEPVDRPLAPQPIDLGHIAAVAEFDALTSPQQPAPATPAPWSPPSGHWTTQLDAEDDPFENTLSRSVRSGYTETNALVLPGMPKDADIRGPLTSTGEVMLTGSIDLPRSLASTGSTDAIEHDGIDALFDINDHEINSTDSSPVRAIRAVSTHNSGHGVTHTQKPKGSKGLTVLLVAAASMAVVVIGLLVGAFAFNVF